jgi:hypothetical protein
MAPCPVKRMANIQYILHSMIYVGCHMQSESSGRLGRICQSLLPAFVAGSNSNSLAATRMTMQKVTSCRKNLQVYHPKLVHEQINPRTLLLRFSKIHCSYLWFSPWLMYPPRELYGAVAAWARIRNLTFVERANIQCTIVSSILAGRFACRRKEDSRMPGLNLVDGHLWGLWGIIAVY